MIQGKNTNLTYKNKKIHVQTEFIKSKKVILTLIFDKGAIIGSKKKKLIFDGPTARFVNKINDKLKRQHKEVLKEIKTTEKPDSIERKAPSEEPKDELMENFLNEVFNVEDDNN
ncbi:MAG: hypothetical protein FXF47_06275 [Candidatus Mcinerneyibacterium aminivorans]|uniref:Uncharacterized protein n=1 Tax=Candidatus Mcinerneyibacterium aminivorans TaxID=2703815 RepID=A0A5D0MDF4_9BACT|nr:MAG: hypothetical protein FXF47_06275 [Candidatus Mcinerneyibacterium aminivorans]